MPYIEFSNPVKSNSSYVVPKVLLKFSMKSLFSNNSLVCYKIGSLASGGVGSVKNCRHKSKNT